MQVDAEQLIDAKLQQQQIIAILKFLEYSGYYTKFRADILEECEIEEFTIEDSEHYIEAYVKYRHHLDDVNNKRVK